ncbi:methyltransferase-like protein 7A [Ixodes scapularis]|uniref:methyltransferase-like protein 7A n=1 Tax=Ixodes scapularis TaxID=6945 RepID=UPI001A9F9A04|nr:methyltransferase-like protein 7A [Ixodes scapularis]
MYAFLSYTLAAILASVTLFFVALKLSKTFREAFFVRVFMPAAGSLVKDEFVAIRREVLSRLNDLESHDPELKKDGIVRVLEVGAGFGANFEFIQRKVKYWNIEPNAEFGPEFMKAAGKNPLVELERCVRGYGEDMAVIPDGCFDAVVVTHLLCSVRDAKRVLGECKRVLAKGGRLLFMEHVAQPKGTWANWFQYLLDPAWELLACGCRLNRSSGDLLKKAGFDRLELKETYLPIPAIISRQVYGYACLQ